MRWVSFLLLAAACSGDDVERVDPLEGLCGEWFDATGELACTHAIPDPDWWARMSVPADAIDMRRTTKYSLSVSADDAVPSLFVNPNQYKLHWDFIQDVFAEEFAGVHRTQYAEMVLDPSNRRFYTGNVSEYVNADGSTSFGFTVWDDRGDLERTLTYEDALRVYQELNPMFGASDLMFVTSSQGQRATVGNWPEAPFVVRGQDRITYEAYTLAHTFGRVRFQTVETLPEATAQAAFGYQDLLVLDQAPFDVERLFAGAVTGTRQGELSHLNVRASARSAPNCFVALPFDALERFEGELVRFACEEDRYTIELADPDEAEAYWAQIRPEPLTMSEPVLTEVAFVGLLDLDTATAAHRRDAVRTYGSKGSNLATLYQRIDADLQLDGFLIPFWAYGQHVRAAEWSVDLGQGAAPATFQETLDAWHDDPVFLSDGRVRTERLSALRKAIRDSEPDPDLVAALAQRIEQQFGNTTTMVRFRSSSNAEDALAFSGAGIYDSTSVCAADSLDDDDTGPSHCDPDQKSERTIERGLLKVWSSLWGSGAWEERDWYGLDHRRAAMGILVNTRSKNERANIVMFTADPSRDDDRVLVNAQLGELDVVSSAPGVFPEQTRLTLGPTGRVTEIDRVRASSEAPGGGKVLSDDQLRSLGEAAFAFANDLPIDETVPTGRDVLIDSEWKVLEDGRLIVKQWRPFLR
ncbi:MAG: PEP/pyruvate-binding domain-containing protein [Myxococcota bacterium]